MATDFLWNRLRNLGRWAERSVLFSKRHEVRSPPQVFTQNISYSVVYVSTLVAILIMEKYATSKLSVILYHKEASLSMDFQNFIKNFFWIQSKTAFRCLKDCLYILNKLCNIFVFTNNNIFRARQNFIVNFFCFWNSCFNEFSAIGNWWWNGS